MLLQRDTAPFSPAGSPDATFPRRRHRRFPAHPALLAAALAAAAVALIPAGFVLVVLVQTGWEIASALIFRPRVAELLRNTFLLEALAVPLAIALAVTLAWLTERTDLPLARLWSWLAVVPLAIPAFVHSYAWDGLFPTLRGLAPAVAISVLAYFPFVYLPVVAQLRRLDPAIEDVAASLGNPPVRVFLRAVLPQLRLAIAGGALLVALHLLAEYGLYVLIRFETLTTAIVDQFQAVYDGPAANLLGILLVACAVGVLALESLLRGDRRYARIGPGAARVAPRMALGRAWPLWMLLPAAVASLSVALPATTLLRWLWRGGADAWAWGGGLGAALGQTAFYAAVGAALTCLAALPVAWLSARAPGRLQRLIEACHIYVGSLPGVVVALALVAITVRVALPLYQTVVTLLAAYVLLYLARAIIALRASLAQVPVELEHAAIALGRPPLVAAVGTTLRLAAPGIAAGMALVAMGITTELTATLMLSPIGTRTLATEFWALTGEFDHVGAAPYALAMILLSLPLCVILYRQAVGAIGR
ncbi:MAG TPA: iron ABC transporter permease [Amaricoccus sp.]|uniref:ABC transporter permease n=1 Tax=Amaricoccus sp. TaxID=1872485 RepID=UPI002C7AEBC7|nr:iron ABC transporter permease [Amaricoccus sp.]HMQ93710.1 iron ABC transporter permease [Amaricoccus sp.]HMR52827.1 iron ABC transporter permease [Amaricoccus sp.]HMR60235.1 iron ABC transporter permease [Amaricoccus sp.]HMT99762.1 iron ABC transporter permease [Amaricoccus sp.]